MMRIQDHKKLFIFSSSQGIGSFLDKVPVTSQLTFRLGLACCHTVVNKAVALQSELNFEHTKTNTTAKHTDAH